MPAVGMSKLDLQNRINHLLDIVRSLDDDPLVKLDLIQTLVDIKLALGLQVDV